MDTFLNNIKNNFIAFISIALSVLGFLLEIIGSFTFCGTTDVGVNLLALQHGMVITGIVFVGLSLLVSVEEVIRAKVIKKDNTAAILAVETACTMLIASFLFLSIFAAWDLIIHL